MLFGKSGGGRWGGGVGVGSELSLGWWVMRGVTELIKRGEFQPNNIKQED